MMVPLPVQADVMRIWIDLTAPAHPVVFRPLLTRLKARGHEVLVTARDYAQTLELCRLHGLDVTVVGTHGGASMVGKAGRLASRTTSLYRRVRRFDPQLAVAHGSNDLALVARMLGVPACNTFDYEWATLQHSIGCRLARRVLVPEAISLERLSRYGVTAERLRHYPGIKEEYYLADFEPDRALLQRLGIDQVRIVVVVRPPPDVSLYHRRSNPLYVQVLEHIGHDEGVHAVVIPRTREQHEALRAMNLPSVIVPEHAIDAQSLIALADLVISAGGTMNREAVALGTPVYTTYGGRLGAVDEALIRSGRLRPATDVRAIEIVKQERREPTLRRDPDTLVDLMLQAA
jgi:predicted glycosyltransferase